MTRAAATALALALVLASPRAALSQEGVPDVPPGDAAIRGRVVHAQTGEPMAETEVVLYALPAQAPPGMRRTTSGPDGSFAFLAIDGSPDTTYLVGARHQDVSYPGSRVVFEPGERERVVEVQVSSVGRDASGTSARALRMRIDWLGERLVVSEAIRLENAGPETVLLPEGEALVRLGLSPGAGALTGPLGVVPQGLERHGDALAWRGPMFPGAHEVEYGYTLPAPTRAVLDRTLPPGLEVSILSPTGGPRLEAPALTEGEAAAMLGRSYVVHEGRVGDDGRLSATLVLPEARSDAGAVSFLEARWIGDLDGALLTVREEHVLRVEGSTPVIGRDAPLARIPLPEGATDVRFGARDSSSGLAPSEGALAVLGPLAPGETTVELAYRLPVTDPLTVTRRFGGALPLVSVYLADNGNLDVDSERLHRRRPVRTQDRTYLHLEAFDVGADEEVAFRIATRPPRATLSATASRGAMALGALLAIALLMAPLRGPSADEADEGEDASQRERRAVYAALRDLEHDFETGKVDAPDHDRMRGELRARALELLGREQEGPQAADAPAACPSCGAPKGPEDRFCSRCGTRLGAEPGAG